MRETDRLILRPFEEADIDPLYEIQGDRDHMRFTHWSESRSACADWLHRYADGRAANGFAPWTVVHRADARVIGWGGLNVDPHAPGWGIEVTYFIHRKYEGRGYATEVVRAAVREGFENLGLAAIGAFVKTANHASIRVLEKCSFALLGYEPALDRNRYEARCGDWADGR